jgi:hypothetical protein
VWKNPTLEITADLVIQSGVSTPLGEGRSSRLGLFDFRPTRTNNPRMARPDAIRRIKSYSAATGYVYQYQFQEVVKSRRGFAAGTDYVYHVSVDRRTTFPMRVFVKRSAVEKWARQTGREITGTEEYAVAKMRLFKAFDELEGLSATSPDLVVDETNLESLLEQLDL